MRDRFVIEFVFLRFSWFPSDCSSLFFHCNITLWLYETLVCVLLYNLGSNPNLKTWGFVETSDMYRGSVGV